MDKPTIAVVIENPDGLTKKEVADKLVEEELEAFDDWIVKTFNGTGHMHTFERAMVKTYIMHKLEDQIAKLTS